MTGSNGLADFPHPDEDTLIELERLAVRLAVTAGRFIVDERPDRLGVAQTKSSPTDVVTEMDQRSEELLRREIQAVRPQDAILGEEGGRVGGRSGLTWVVDPIDGTVNYLYQLPAYSVSVAAVVGDPLVPGAWAPVAGAVCNPVVGEVFHARLGSGAFLTGMPRSGPGGWLPPSSGLRLRVTAAELLKQALVATGFEYQPEVRAWQAELISVLLPRVRDIRRAGSAALDLAGVAAGRTDGYLETGLNPWDLAAGWLLVTEAGGLLSGFGGAPPSAGGVVAAGPGLFPLLTQAVDELLPRRPRPVV